MVHSDFKPGNLELATIDLIENPPGKAKHISN